MLFCAIIYRTSITFCIKTALGQDPSLAADIKIRVGQKSLCYRSRTIKQTEKVSNLVSGPLV